MQTSFPPRMEFLCKNNLIISHFSNWIPMNKICIFLLLAYIGFMACSVKKQMSRSAILSDSLLNMENKKKESHTHYLNDSAHVIDGISLNDSRHNLFVDSIDWLIRDSPHYRRLVIHGIRWSGKNARMADVKYADIRNTAKTTYTADETTILKTHVHKQEKKIGRNTAKPAFLWAALLIIVSITGVALLYFLRKKIFPFSG